MKYQYISDVHTEFYTTNSKNFPQVTPHAPILILAGDIGCPVSAKSQYKRFLDQVSKDFEMVFITSGNHEFHLSSFAETRITINNIIKEYINIIFLDKNRIDIDDNTTILGCTLWSHITENQRPFIKSSMADFSNIADFSIEKYNEIHQEEVSWLEKEIEFIKHNEPHRKIIIVTHHAPLIHGTSSPLFKDSKISSAFSTDLTELIKHPVYKWIFGHTHYSSKLSVNDIDVVSFQKGYPGEYGTGYSDEASALNVFEI